MNSLKLALVAVSGFALGAVLFHTPAVKAQGTVKVTITGGRMIGYTLDNGSQIVGFSCIENDGSPECYVASIK
jgi:hypothetical protein